MKAAFIETSAVTGENIESAFVMLSKKIIKLIKEG
jgi:hypothetical protein